MKIPYFVFLVSMFLFLSFSCGKSQNSSKANKVNTNTNTDIAAPLKGLMLSPISDNGGVVTADFSANTTSTQVLNASSSANTGVAGSQLGIASGVITSTETLSFGEADSIVSQNTYLDLSITDTSMVVSALPTVFVTPSSNTADPLNPITVQMPRTSGTLKPNGVIYRVQKEASPGKTYTGFLRAFNFTVYKNAINFTPLFYGAYQPVVVSSRLGSVPEFEGPTPIVPITNQFPSGTWTSTCQACRFNIARCYETDNFTSNGSSVVFTFTHYSDSKCTNQTDVSVQYSTYVVRSAVSVPVGATAVDMYINRYFVTPTGSTGAAALNAGAYCGYLDWATNAEKDVTTSICFAESPHQTGQGILYSNFMISGSNLHLGLPTNKNVDDGTTEAKRMTGTSPTVLTK